MLIFNRMINLKRFSGRIELSWVEIDEKAIVISLIDAVV